MERILKNVIIGDIIEYVIMKYHKYYKDIKILAINDVCGGRKIVGTEGILYNKKKEMLYLIENQEFNNNCMTDNYYIYDLKEKKSQNKMSLLKIKEHGLFHRSINEVLCMVNDLMMFRVLKKTCIERTMAIFKKYNSMKYCSFQHEISDNPYGTIFDGSYIYVCDDIKPCIYIYLPSGHGIFHKKLELSRPISMRGRKCIYTSKEYIYIMYIDMIDVYSKISFNKINSYKLRADYIDMSIIDDMLYVVYWRKNTKIYIYNAITYEKIKVINNKMHIDELFENNNVLFVISDSYKTLGMYSI